MQSDPRKTDNSEPVKTLFSPSHKSDWNNCAMLTISCFRCYGWGVFSI